MTSESSLLDFVTVETLARETNSSHIREILNAKAWEWFVEHYESQVGVVWMQVKVHVRDVRELFIKLFGESPADRL